MTSVFSAAEARGPGPRGLGATLLLISEDAAEAAAIRHMLPSGSADWWVWCATTAEAARVLALRRGPTCVLVGRTPNGAHPAEIAHRVRRLAPGVPVVVVAEAAAPVPPGRSPDGATGRQDAAAVDRTALGRAIRLALQRQHLQRALAATQDRALIARDSASLERGLLPAPALRGDDFAAAWRYRPGRSHALLGGDFYDVVQGDDSSIHVVLGDVSGHGAVEAALAVHLRIAWRTAVLCGMDQLQQLDILERVLTAERTDEDTYATVVSAVFRPDRASMTVVNAGHPGMLHRRPSRVRWVEPRTGIALGLFPGYGDWTPTEMELGPHDSVVLFTDGLFEGRAEPAARLGEDGLLQVATEHAHLPPQEFVDALVARATSMAAPFGGVEDDMAVLHLGWRRQTA